MNKIAVVFWSGTGNTEKMARAVARGAEQAGGESLLLSCSDFDVNSAASVDAIAFGCPAMGDEELEDSEFEPMFDSLGEALKNKKIALFGSYGWGDGEWMRRWEERCRDLGAVQVSGGLICCEEPDENTIQQCEELGSALAKA